MPFVVERIPDLPIVVCTTGPEVDGVNDPPESHARVHELLAEEQGPLFRVLDFSQVEVNFMDVVMGMNADPGFKNERMQTMMIGTDALVQLAASSAAQEQDGGVDIKLFTSVEDAVTAAQADLAR